MQITKELMEAKMKEYLAQQGQLQANQNAVAGAIQGLKQLMDELDKSDPVSPDVTPAAGE